METNCLKEPVKRSRLRVKTGMAYYGFLRYFIWLRMNKMFANEKSDQRLPYLRFSHKTPLLRNFKEVDIQYQYNKIINLKIAASKLNGVVIHPGEVFSYWKLIGKPAKSKGYVKGMILRNGSFTSGTGGGLCQMSNLIYWMTLHTPLKVIERHRHGYDVFPDSNRTQPFGSGATCFYPHGDLMVKNDTIYDFQLIVNVGKDYLEGEWRSTAPSKFRYKVVERNHEMRGEYWGGYSRHNELYKQVFDANGIMITEEFVAKNSAIMTYSPFLPESVEKSDKKYINK